MLAYKKWQNNDEENESYEKDKDDHTALRKNIHKMSYSTIKKN